jgi:hypothetical protein
VDLQLDLWVRKVFYADAHTPRREQYLITNAFRFE